MLDRVRKLEYKFSILDNELKEIKANTELRFDALESNITSFPEDAAVDIACDQFLKSVEVEEEPIDEDFF